MASASLGWLKTVTELLRAGADPARTDWEHRTASDYALRSRRADIDAALVSFARHR